MKFKIYNGKAFLVGFWVFTRISLGLRGNWLGWVFEGFLSGNWSGLVLSQLA